MDYIVRLSYTERMYNISDALHLPVRSSSIDLVIADPPFGISFDGRPSNYNRDASLVCAYVEHNDQSDFALASVLEMRRIIKDTGTIWLIMGFNNLDYWQAALRKCFYSQIGHVVWKYQFGVYAKKRPVVSHYHLLVYSAGKKWTWNQQGYDEDVWQIKRPYYKGVLKYPNRLPADVVRNIIVRSSNVGDVVYDPFVGSGTSVVESSKLGRIGFGSDIQNNKAFWN